REDTEVPEHDAGLAKHETAFSSVNSVPSVAAKRSVSEGTIPTSAWPGTSRRSRPPEPRRGSRLSSARAGALPSRGAAARPAPGPLPRRAARGRARGTRRASRGGCSSTRERGEVGRAGQVLHVAHARFAQAFAVRGSDAGDLDEVHGRD